MSDDPLDEPGDERDGEEGESTDQPPQGDPFEELSESVGDRRGDPFEHLDDEGGRPPASDVDASAGDADEAGDADIGWHPPGGPEEEWSPPESGSGDGAATGDTPADRAASDPALGAGPDAGSTGPDAEGPGATAPEDRTVDPFESGDSTFQRMEVGEVDPDQVWAELAEAQERGSVADARKRTYAEVSKHRFCEGCEYFTGPPAVNCTHEGTQILEFVDMERVRVVDCPVVAERQALEEE